MVLLLDCCDEVREHGGTHSALARKTDEFADAAIALHSRDGVDGVTNRIIFGHVVEDSQTEAATDGSSDGCIHVVVLVVVVAVRLLAFHAAPRTAEREERQ